MPDNNGIPIPPGQDNQGNTILGVDLAFFTISTIFVVLRVGTRLGITRNFGWDDATIVLAQLLTVVGKVFVIEEVTDGFGQHNTAINTATYSKFLMFDYLDWAQTILVLAATKISICLFLLRLSQFSRLKNILYGLIALTVISHVPLFFAYVFQCNPIMMAWNSDRPGCFSKNSVETIIVVQGVFSILIDFACAAFPLVLLRDTNLKVGTKLALSLLMGLGIITSIVCIVRTAFSWQVKSNDLSWVETPNALARIIEVNLGITLACAPIMKPFIQYVNASVTGNDQHMHGGRRPPMEHVQWHSGFRITPPAPSRRSEPRQPRKLPAAAYRISDRAARQFDPPSIVLPIQKMDSKPTSFQDEEAIATASRPVRSHTSRANNLWDMDDSLERHMLAAVEYHKM